MSNELTNTSWASVLAFYDSLNGPQWKHIPLFRELVSQIGSSEQASGLVAVISLMRLIISPYTHHLDWFAGRHVLVVPFADGTVRVEFRPARFDPQPIVVHTLTVETALDEILHLIMDL